jgi:hypothetical protein
LWKQSAHAKLLQRPPAQKISFKQAALLQDTAQEIAILFTAIDKAAAACRVMRNHSGTHTGLRFLDAILAARPVATLSQLLVWLQQGIALLQLPELATEMGSEAESRAAAPADGSTNSSSNSRIAAAQIAAASAAEVSSGSSRGGVYGKLWLFCASGMLAHALAAVDSFPFVGSTAHPLKAACWLRVDCSALLCQPLPNSMLSVGRPAARLSK